MKKERNYIILTESELQSIVKDSVKNVLKEMSPTRLADAGRKAKEEEEKYYGDREYEKLRNADRRRNFNLHAIDSWNKKYGIDKEGRKRYMEIPEGVESTDIELVKVVDIFGDKTYIYYPAADTFQYINGVVKQHQQKAEPYKLFDAECYKVARQMVNAPRKSDSITGKISYKKYADQESLKKFVDEWNKKYHKDIAMRGYEDYRRMYISDNGYKVYIIDKIHGDEGYIDEIYTYNPASDTVTLKHKNEPEKSFQDKDAKEFERYNDEPYIVAREFFGSARKTDRI